MMSIAGDGAAKSKRRVTSSIRVCFQSWPPGVQLTFNVGVSSLFCATSSYQNMKSSVVNGWPSDHFMPLRSLTVTDLKSLATSKLLRMFGVIVLRSGSICSRFWTRMLLSSRPPLLGPKAPARMTPPYLPTCSALTTSGSSESLSLSGGSLPALTSSASIGASLYWPGAAIAAAGAAAGAGAVSFWPPANTTSPRARNTTTATARFRMIASSYDGEIGRFMLRQRPAPVNENLTTAAPGDGGGGAPPLTFAGRWRFLWAVAPVAQVDRATVS